MILIAGLFVLFASVRPVSASSWNITVTSNPAGTGFVEVDSSPVSTPQVFTWTNGDTHTLSAASSVTIAGVPYLFQSWSDGGNQMHTITVPNSTTTYTANYLAQVQVTITSNPVGSGYLDVDGNPVVTPQTFTWLQGDSHSLQAASPVGCGAGCQYAFGNWSDGGAGVHTYTVLGTSATVTALFQPQYQLRASSSSSSLGSVSCGSSFYNAGTLVSCSAVPNGAVTFAGWTLDGTNIGTLNPLHVSMGGPHILVANFNPPPTVVITVTSNPAGSGFVTVDGAAVSTPRAFTWTVGTVHELRANSPLAAGGSLYTFQSWSDSGAQTHNVTAPASPTTYTATFQQQYPLTMQASPSGAGSTNPSGLSYIAAGSSVTVSALPNSGSTFISWSGVGSGSYTGANNPATITMNGPITEVADFQNPSTVQVIVTSSPTTQANLVSVDGAPISTPQTLVWTVGSTHTLSAVGTFDTSSGVRYRFQSWSDGHSRTRTVIAPAGSLTYIAYFQIQYYLAMLPGNGGSTTPHSGWYMAGSSVTISAYPHAGYVFLTWLGTGSGSYSGIIPTETITINGPATEFAAFSTRQGAITITITSSPTGSGQLFVDGVQVSSPDIVHWQLGSWHTISAYNTDASQFQYWASDGAEYSTSSAINIYVDSSHTYTAYFSAVAVPEFPAATPLILISALGLAVFAPRHITHRRKHIRE